MIISFDDYTNIKIKLLNHVFLLLFKTTALIFAIEKEFLEIVKLLLANSTIDINKKVILNQYFIYNFI